MEKKVSIIIPIYNVDKYLNQCVESLIHQSYNNLEIILVNDGSNDESEKICLHYSKIDNRVHYIHKANGGVSSARNAGIDFATGDYITFVDPDDWCENTMYSVLVNIAMKNDLDAIFCGFSMESDLSEDQKLYGQIFDGCVSKEEAWKYMFDQDGYYTSIWNKMFRTGIIKGEADSIYFDTGIIMGEDEEWLSRILNKCSSIYLLSTPFYHWIRHTSGACSTLLNNHTVTNQQIHGYKVAKLVRDRLSHYDSVKNILNARYYNAAFGLVKNLYLDDNRKEANILLHEIKECRVDWQSTFARTNKSRLKHLLQRIIIQRGLPKKALSRLY